jgi:hypothetical protein
MPEPRKPTAILESSGAFDKNPQRRGARANEPVPSGEIGDPPKGFDKTLKSIWREFITEAPPGVLKNSDRKNLELACLVMKEIRRGTAKAADRAQLHKCLVSMGMTPADRSRVSVAKKQQTLREMLEAPIKEVWDSTPEKLN